MLTKLHVLPELARVDEPVETPLAPAVPEPISVIRLEIMPMRRPAPWMVKQWAIAAGNAPNWNFNGPGNLCLSFQKWKTNTKTKFFLL